jgi:hypothetical protein
MSRTTKLRTTANAPMASKAPVTKEQYVRETRESCKDGRCCLDEGALEAAYEQYLNNPHAPWNKIRRAKPR